MAEYSIENTCRICLKNYDDLSKLKDINDYADVINSLTQTKIYENVLIPTKICQNCVGLILLSNMVRTNLINSQRKWIDYLLYEGEQDTEALKQYKEDLEEISDDSSRLCRICLNPAEDDEIYVSQLPEYIKCSFLNLREYQNNVDIPENICKNCVQDLEITNYILNAFEMIANEENDDKTCLICKELCRKDTQIDSELVAFMLSINIELDLNLKDKLWNGLYCDACLQSLRIAKMIRYKSFKSEEVLKMQYENDLKTMEIVNPVEIEYMDEGSSIDVDRDEVEEENYDENLKENEKDEDDYFNLQLNTPPLQILYSCAHCHKTYTYEKDLEMHVDIMHQTKGTLCTECGMNCRSIASLRQHKIRMHYQIYDHLCEICGRQFPGRPKYLAHVVTHFDVRSVLCQVCSATFKTKKSLNLHMRTHTGEKPYACDVCDKRFSHFSDKKRHTYTHTKVYPYNCEVCKKGFAKKNFLRKHQEQHVKIIKKSK